MNFMNTVGIAWDRYCRRLDASEAGALWCLIGMAGSSRVRGVVLARWCVVAVAMNVSEESAKDIVRSLSKKGSVSLTEREDYEAPVMITVFAFNDVWERVRACDRQRKQQTRVKSVRRSVRGRRSVEISK